MTKPNDFDLLKGLDENMSPEAQFEFLQNDPGFSQRLMSGDMQARHIFDTATRNWVEYQAAQAAAALDAGKADWIEPEKSPLEDPAFIERFNAGDVETVAQFEALTRGN